MTNNGLLRIIRNRQKENYQILETPNMELSFLEHFFKENNLSGFDNILSINFTDFVKAYLTSQVTDDNDREEVFKYLYSKVESIKDIIEELSDEELTELIEICNILKEKDCQLIAIDIFNDPNKHRGKFTLRKKLVGNAIEEESLEELLELHEPKGSNVGNFIELYDTMDFHFVNAIYIVADIKQMKDSYDSFLSALEIYGPKSNERKWLITKYRKEQSTNLDQLNDYTQSIRTHLENLRKKDRALRKNAQREMSAYQSLERYLIESVNKEEITDGIKFLSKITDEEVRIQTLKLIYEHNAPYYECLSQEYQQLSQNSSIRYQALLNEYSITNVDVSTIMQNDVATIKDILTKLQILQLKNNDTIVAILQVVVPETFEHIYGYLKQGLLKIKFIEQHPIIFDPTSDEYQNFVVNMKLFKEIGFNPNNLIDSQQILISNPNTIGKNIEILRAYGFEKSFRKNIDYSFLLNEELIQQLDKALELGLEQFLEEDLSLLNYYEKFDRIRVLQQLNIPFTSKEEVIECLTTKTFLVPDDKIFNYIDLINPKEIKMDSLPDNINILKQYQKTPRVYDVNGVLLSKKRIERNYTESEDIENRTLYSILHESILSHSNYRTLKETFSQTLTYK